MGAVLNTTQFLVFDWGMIKCPPDMMPLEPLRKDGQPDRRYRGGKEWSAKFQAMNERGCRDRKWANKMLGFR